MEKNKIFNKSPQVKKWDFFFAFYRFSYFYKLWFIVYVISIFVSFLFDMPFLLRYIGTIVVSATISLTINGTIVFFIDVSDDTPIGNSDNYGRGPSAQTMRMLKRNIRRRWFWLVTYITPSLPYDCISSQVSFLMSLFLNAVRQENRKARFKAGAEQGVDAKRITSSCERCSLSVGIVSIRSKKPFGFSFILRSR